jgi:pimeloyl-ACP methyl ester carboxylesterase
MNACAKVHDGGDDVAMKKTGLTVGCLVLAGSVAWADPQEHTVTLPGTASAAGAAWKPSLKIQEQKSGSGERPVLYVHGFTFPSSLSVFWKLDGRSWADALNEAGFSVWGFDLAGYGGSERYPEMNAASPRQGPPLGAPQDAAEQIARVVSHILEQTKAGRVSIVAHSIGTIPVGLFASRHPDQVERIVFFGPAARRQLEVLPNGLPSSSAGLPQWRLVTVKDQFDRFVLEVPAGHKPVLPDRHFQPWAHAYLATDPTSSTRGPASVRVPNGPLAGLIDAWTGKLAYDPAGIKSPLLVVRGEWDTLSTGEDARWLLSAATASPEKKYVEVPEATHLMLLEENRHALYRATNAFLLGR